MQSAEALIQDFNLQRRMRPELGKAVGHLVLSWSKEDRLKLTDTIMAERAQEYLDKVGIKDTQYVIVRHSDREHAHLHLIYNRVDNKGKTISDQNNYAKNVKACKEITLKYGYHIGVGKDKVNRQALIGKEKNRYELYDAIRYIMKTAAGLDELKERLEAADIKTEFKYKSNTTEVQGISFDKGSIRMKGSAIDRSLSFGNIQKQLNLNYQRQTQANQKPTQLNQREINQAQPNGTKYTTPKVTDRHQHVPSSDKLIAALFKPDDSITAIDPNGYALSTNAKRKKRKTQRL